jgi:hypothetical protein
MDPNDVEVHLRGASDAIMLLLSQVSQLESHKRGIVPGSPRFIELAHSVREASQALADFAREEEKWAQQAPLGRQDGADDFTLAQCSSPGRHPESLARGRTPFGRGRTGLA